MEKNYYDVIVIGSGLGGLTAGALAAKAGARVLLLEQHYIFGGAATVFSRKKMKIEVGLHEIDGLDEKDAKHSLFTHLGIFENIDFLKVPEFYSIRHHSLGEEPFVMPDSPKAVREESLKRFPQHKKALKKWFDTLDWIWDKLQILSENQHKPWWWVLNIPIFPFRFWPVLRYERVTLTLFLEQLFGDDEAVKFALCANLSYYSKSSDMSLLFFAMAQVSFYRGGHYIRGGSQKLSDYLAKVIRDGGGETRTSRPVTEILLKDGEAVGVVHTNTKGSDQEKALAPILFGNAAPSVLAEMLPKTEREAFSKNYANRSLSTSLWSIYLGFDRSPNELGVEQYSSFVYPVWMDSLRQLPESSFLLNAAPNKNIPAYTVVNYDKVDHGIAEEGRSLIVLCGLDSLSYWENLDREEYKARKSEWMNAIVEDLLRVFPELREHLVYKEMATARTVHRYLKTPGGAVYGFAQTLSDSGRHRPAAKTSISGLYLASAFAQPGGGFTGAMLAGQNAFEAVSSKIRRKK